MTSSERLIWIFFLKLNHQYILDSNRRNVDNTNLLGKNENVEVFPVLQLRFGRNDLSDRHPFQRLRYQLFIPFTR